MTDENNCPILVTRDLVDQRKHSAGAIVLAYFSVRWALDCKGCQIKRAKSVRRWSFGSSTGTGKIQCSHDMATDLQVSRDQAPSRSIVPSAMNEDESRTCV